MVNLFPEFLTMVKKVVIFTVFAFLIGLGAGQPDPARCTLIFLSLLLGALLWGTLSSALSGSSSEETNNG